MGNTETHRSSLSKVLLNPEQESVGLRTERAGHKVFLLHAPTRNCSCRFVPEYVHKGLLPAPVHIYSLVSTHAYRGLLRAEISRMP